MLSILWSSKLEDHLIDVSEVIYSVPTTRKVVALTFDDGPVNKATEEILAILKEKDVKATFFVIGKQAEKFPMLVTQEIAEGHEVGNHTYSHPQLTKLSKNKIEEELDKTEKEILKVATKPSFFRPPEGAYDNTVFKIARHNEYSIILWSIDTNDWRYPSVGEIVNSVLKDVKPGSIILLHDGLYPSSTPEALWFIIDSLKSQGYEFVTISELLQYYEEGAK
jgi:polysaccharide deacetylase family sporulation protein PdaB